MIRITNWILTRRCNLSCDYCSIVKNYKNMPKKYPKMSHYIKKEMTTKLVLDILKLLKEHNPDMFHIFYGGEPTLRNDLPDIINYCNKNRIEYTIISNNTPEIQPAIRNLFKKTDFVQGFTSSVDPVFNNLNVKKDMIKKSIEGLKRLKEIQTKGLVKDVVAEITVMKHNQHLLPDLVKELSLNEIYSDITFVDIAKNSYYDFSNIYEYDELVKPTYELATMFQNFINNKNLLIHMKNLLLPWMFNTLPSNFDCEIEKNLHNITIDADGTLRLCLRIRGELSPRKNITDIFDEFGEVKESVQKAIQTDKKSFCELCNHSCLMMSKHINETNKDLDQLVHNDKREINYGR